MHSILQKEVFWGNRVVNENSGKPKIRKNKTLNKVEVKHTHIYFLLVLDIKKLYLP